LKIYHLATLVEEINRDSGWNKSTETEREKRERERERNKYTSKDGERERGIFYACKLGVH
jgi:hypothetical protein